MIGRDKIINNWSKKMFPKRGTLQIGSLFIIRDVLMMNSFKLVNEIFLRHTCRYYSDQTPSFNYIKGRVEATKRPELRIKLYGDMSHGKTL